MKMRSLLFSWSVLLLAALAGCRATPVDRGRFEGTLNVTGEVMLELENGSGEVRISPGQDNEVRIQGEFRVRAWFWEDPRNVAAELRDSPPIEQHGNYIRVGQDRPFRNVHIDYVITVPRFSEVKATVGSGSLEVRGVRGPARLHAGSGDVTAQGIGGDTEVQTGSGDVYVKEVGGDLRATAGSGDLRLEGAGGDVRATAGSGDILILDPGGRVTTKTGSGDVEVRGARGDVTMTTGSGDLSIEGSPPPRSFWDLRTASGGIRIDVPRDASFVFHARSRSSRIETDIPIEVTERSRRELRGRVGAGEARVTVETGSGRVVLR